MKPKSKVRLEFLNACLYSPRNNGCSDAKSLLLIVKSLSLLIAQKYGIFIEEPKFLASLYEGIKKPDRLLTEGSG